MTAAAHRFPEWIRRKLTDESGDTSRSEQGSAATTGGRIDQEPVVVWEALHQMEAEVVKGRLEAEGIPAIIRSEAVGLIYGFTSGGLAQADVLVPAALADQAIALLAAESDAGEGAGEGEPDLDSEETAGADPSA